MNALELRRRTLGKGVYKKTVEGNPAIAQGSLARRYPGITMQGWTTQDGTPTPESPVPIVSAGTQNQDTGKWEYEITITNAQTDATKNQTVTLTSDRPLTKWDKLEKRGGQWGWVYKSKIVDYTGQEDGWKARSLTTHSFEIFILPDICKEGMSNYFSNITNPEIDNKTGIYTNSTGVLIFTSMSISTLDEWKNWLTEKSDGGVPMRVAYETVEETFTPLSTSEQEQMNALRTFRPTTVLSNDCECEMTLTYKTKKSLEVTT